MWKVETELEELQFVIETFREAPVVRPVDVDTKLHGLHALVATLQGKIAQATHPKPTVEVEQTYARWKERGFDFAALDTREQRALCIHPEYAIKPEVVQAAGQHPEIFRRTSTLFGFVNAYFTGWRTFPEPEKMETLIVLAIREKRRSLRSHVLAKWDSSPFLFGRDAEKHLGRMVVQQRVSVASLCSQFFIGETTNLARRTTEAALAQALQVLTHRPAETPPPKIREEVLWIKDNLLGRSLEASAFRQCMAVLIQFADRRAEVRDLVTAYVVGDVRLGDPRLPANDPNWRSMPEGARTSVLSWFAQENLEFFFNAIVPRNDENRRRAEFWLGFAKRAGNIKDFQVAISPDDIPKVRRAARDVGRYAALRGARTSAFMMLFQGRNGREYVIIEFSETGNAAYIYERSQFEKYGDTLRAAEFERQSLRRQADVVDRIIHNGAWERDAVYKLNEMGIRP
jgi:hypothetical protein